MHNRSKTLTFAVFSVKNAPNSIEIVHMRRFGKTKAIIAIIAASLCCAHFGFAYSIPLKIQPRFESDEHAEHKSEDYERRRFWGKIVIGSAIISGMLLFRFIANRKAQRRYIRILKSLPGRIGVCTRDFSLMFFHTENEQLNRKKLKNLSEVKNIDFDAISAAITKVFNTKTAAVLDYDYKHVRRSMTISPLDDSVFGRECVIWFSHDNTELQEARDQAERYAKQSAENMLKLRQNTRMWHILLNALPMHVFAKNPSDDFRYAFANKKTNEFFGRDITGLTDFDIFEKSEAERRRFEDIENMKDLTRGFEANIPLKDFRGKTHLMRNIRYPFNDESGHTLLLGASLDVSEVLESAKIRERTESFWENAVENFPIMAFAKDADGGFKYIAANRQVCEFLGIPKAELIGKTDAEIPAFAPMLEEIRARDEAAVEAGEHSVHTLFVPDGRGEKRLLRAIRKPITLSDGRRILCFTIADISDLADESLKKRLICTEKTPL